ncbi:MAG: hypothetical protein NC218_06565 [Acetobacter sp.]|nr:hypothetical protein [Acetobacter sp.]
MAKSDLEIAYEKAYGEHSKTMLDRRMEVKEASIPLNVAEMPNAEEMKIEIPKEMEQSTPVQEMPVVETKAPEAEQKAPEVQAAIEEKPQLVTPNSKAKEKYPSLFSLFSDMMTAGDSDKKSDEMWEAMFAWAIGAMMGVDVFKERLEQAEREQTERLLAEMREKERLAAAEKEGEVKAPEKETATRVDVGAATIPLQVAEKPDLAQVNLNIPQTGNVNAAKLPEQMAEKPDLSQIKIKTPAEIAYDNIAKGKDEVTLADLKAAGVNLKTDLAPTLKALTKDNPEKLAELAPKGLGDENAPIGKELGVALIGRQQQREAMIKHNSLSR